MLVLVPVGFGLCVDLQHLGFALLLNWGCGRGDLALGCAWG